MPVCGGFPSCVSMLYGHHVMHKWLGVTWWYSATLVAEWVILMLNFRKTLMSLIVCDKIYWCLAWLKSIVWGGGLVWWCQAAVLNINSLAPGKCSYFKILISGHTLQIKIMRNSSEISLRWMPQNTSDDKSTLVQVMGLCHQATSHYLSTMLTQICVAIWCY